MRRRLAAVTLAAAALIVISFVAPLGILVRRQAEDRALSAAESDARSVATAIAVATSFAGGPMDAAAIQAVLAAFGSPDRISVHLPDGGVVGTGFPGDPDVAVARNTGAAFTARTPDGAAVLVPVFTPDGTLVVRNDIPRSDLSAGVLQAWIVLAALAAGLSLIAVVAADRLGRSIVGPVTRLRRATGALASGDLGVRVEPGGPSEIVDVAHAFNALAERLGELLQEEREAAADISHGLRTPVAALRLQVESLSDPVVRSGLLEDVAALETAIGEVIRDARSRGDEAPRRADLAAVAVSRAGFWQVLAAEQDRSLEVRVPPTPVWVRTGQKDATTVLDTLIENVFAHTEPGIPLTVEVVVDPATLVVSDGGPGFPDSAIARGATTGRSTGLGLDIVRRIAERSGGGLVVDRSDLGGARVTVHFGSLEE